MTESREERQAAQQTELQGLLRHLTKLTPKIWVVPTLVAANLIVFVIMWASGVDPFSPTTEGVLGWGANFGPATTSGEWWRLASSMFVHFGLLHIALNLFVLWDAGRLVERLLGNVGFLVMYVVSGLAGSLTSLAYNPFAVSAGASGAVFGVFGAMFGFVLLHRRNVSSRAAFAGVGRSAAIFIVANVAIGLSVKQIDLAAHLGGLGAGFLCGLAMSQGLGERARTIRWQRNTLVALVGAAAVVAGAFLVSRSDFLQAFRQVEQTERQVNAAGADALRRLLAGELDSARFAQVIEQNVLAPWRAARKRLAEAKTPDSATAQKEEILRRMDKRERGWKESAAAARPATAEVRKQMGKTIQQLGEALKKMLETQQQAAPPSKPTAP